MCVCVQADPGGVAVRSHVELAAAVGHREVRRRPEAGAAGLSGAPTAAGTNSPGQQEERTDVSLFINSFKQIT